MASRTRRGGPFAEGKNNIFSDPALSEIGSAHGKGWLGGRLSAPLSVVVQARTLAGDRSVPWVEPIPGKQEFCSSRWRWRRGGAAAGIIQNEFLERALRPLVRVGSAKVDP
jgi:hypothetical protein